MRYLLLLSFKGTAYHGWQRQENAHTVQSELELKISLLLGEHIECVGCGRTDAGVHAKEFYAHFDVRNELDTDKCIYKLNQILPDDIAVHSLQKVDDEFHARFDATSREYEYVIARKPNPFLTDTAWYWYGQLDIAQMNAMAGLLHGEHDFEAFSKVHTQVNHFRCHVTKAVWEDRGDTLVFTIAANRFLRNMVRAIVGTLMEVGQGKCNEQEFKQIIEGKNRSAAGQSVPAHGLFLTSISYPEIIV